MYTENIRKQITRKDIVYKLIPILNRIGHQKSNYIEANFDIPLTGKYFAFSAINMTYLYLEVLKEFHITIDQEILCGYGFNTINSIIKIIMEGGEKIEKQIEEKK